MFINTVVVNMFLNKPFILASNSISRYNLLKNTGLKFIKKKPLCDEDYIKKNLIKKNNIRYLPKLLAKEKALSISIKNPKRLVVGSDTIIIFDNKLINKAKNINEARTKLKKLSGKKHQIISGVSVCYGSKQIWSTQQYSTITMQKLNQQQINEYINKPNGFCL